MINRSIVNLIKNLYFTQNINLFISRSDVKCKAYMNVLIVSEPELSDQDGWCHLCLAETCVPCARPYQWYLVMVGEQTLMMGIIK